MQDAGVVARLVSGQFGFFLQDDDAAGRKLPCDLIGCCQPDDSAAYYDHVRLHHTPSFPKQMSTSDCFLGPVQRLLLQRQLERAVFSQSFCKWPDHPGLRTPTGTVTFKVNGTSEPAVTL
jgi:hypothetical protein